MIDATIGGSTSNSYVTLAFANAYMTSRTGALAWDELDDSTKEAHLLTATRQIEVAQWSGVKLHRTTQNLQWPRTGLYDFDSNIILNIPKQLINAQMELVYWQLTEGDRLLSDTDLQQVGSLSAGPLNITAIKGPSFFPALVIQMLQAIGPGILMKTPGAPITQSVRFVI